MDYKTRDEPLAIDCLLMARYFHPQADELAHRATFMALSLHKNQVKLQVCSPETSPDLPQCGWRTIAPTYRRNPLL